MFLMDTKYVFGFMFKMVDRFLKISLEKDRDKENMHRRHRGHSCPSCLLEAHKIVVLSRSECQ